MDKYFLCVIDDKIPVNTVAGFDDDTVILTSTSLEKLLLDETKWTEPEIRDLIKTLISKKELWYLSAFTNPNFYFNHFEKEFYRADIIVYDWDYPGVTEPEKCLLEVLEKSFSIVFIYTRFDKKHEVKEMINTKPFLPFNNRLNLFHKEDEDSVKILIEKINTTHEKNFSFRFGREIRKKSIEATDKVLVELGKVTLNQTANYFNLTGDSGKDLIEFIGERFKNLLNDSKFETIAEIKDDSEAAHTEELVKELWSHRLYYYGNDDDRYVRKGDILYNESDELDNLYLVVSADCDLAKFWHKNLGFLNVVKLNKIHNSNSELINKLTLTRNKGNLKLSQSSLTSVLAGGPPGAFILPFLKIGTEFELLMGFPKEMTNIKVEAPKDIEKDALKKEILKYDHLKNLKLKRVATISEPFLSPLIEHIFSSIAGYGVPDYSQKVVDIIKNLSSKCLD